ncbi:MAG: pseudouridine synthase [Proteobacteria bacterium]|nr:pseudouridine synthase [Pseudomonadota bacterium]
MKRWLLNLLIAVDQLANALLRGAPDETLSSRAHRMRAKGQPYWAWTARAIDALFFFDPEHCRKAYESEQQRRHLPPALQA